MAKENCWEYKQCGRESGGQHAVGLGVCPAAMSSAFDGLHDGKYSGRVCWAVSGTFCGGDVQGSFAAKAGNCLKCDFFKQVNSEESNLLSFTDLLTTVRANGSPGILESRDIKRSVLVVDDSSTTRLALKKKIEQAGYRVFEASNGNEALDVAVEKNPDMITLDIEMPERDGLQTCAALRNIDTFAEIPVVFITCKDTFENRKKGFELGALDFISKDTDDFFGEAISTIHKILRPSQRFKGLKALLVEENEIINYQISSSLYNQGIEVFEAADDLQAIKIVDKHADEIDLVITEFESAAIFGATVTQHVRAYPQLRHVPVIFLCNDKCLRISSDTFQAGATDYLVKPFSREEMMARLNVHLEARLLIKRLASEMQKNKMILQSAREGIVVVDAMGKVTLVNQAASEMLGWKAEEVCGKEFHETIHFARHDGSKSPLDECPIYLSYTRGTVQEVADDVFWHKYGDSLPVKFSSSPIIKEDSIEGAVIVFSDISAQKQIVDLREEVEQITRHDLKTPLSGIIGVSRLLKYEENLTDRQKEFLEMVESSGYRMLNMINSSLTLCKIERGEYETEPVKVDLLKTMKTVEGEIAEELRRKNIAVRYLVDGEDVTDTCVEGYVYAEDMLCYSMLANLLKNASEASGPDQSMEVSFKKNGRNAELVITNSGVVPKAIRNDFFSKYVTKGKKGGTGLGTYSARLMARAQGGDITMSTSGSSGTSIFINLPLPPLEN